jgi:hypothetical protein
VSTQAPEQTARTQQAQLILASAAAYQAEQESAKGEALIAILAVWYALNRKNLVQDWVAGAGERTYVLLSILQELVARDANSYIRRTLALQGITYTGPDINPTNFAGIASDGRNLESLLAQAIAVTRRYQREGRSDDESMQRGESLLRLIVNTQVSDAGRAAESVSNVVADGEDENGKKVQTGWIRLLTPPSCGRCAILAGKFYKWSDGFERHPNCDCRHVAVSEEVADDVLSNPYVYFNSLSEEEQNYYFGTSQAKAIRSGADINQVINATNVPGAMFTADDGRRYTTVGTTRRGLARKRSGEVLRPTPWQIYQDAEGDLEAAREALYRYGYVI